MIQLMFTLIIACLKELSCFELQLQGVVAAISDAIQTV